jgi:hypothetical protein
MKWKIKAMFETTNQNRWFNLLEGNYQPSYLLGGIPTPSEKYESVGMILPNIWKTIQITNQI